MKTKYLLRFILIIFSLLAINSLWAQPEIPATRLWTGKGDGHTWSDPSNWSTVICFDPITGVYSNVYSVPATGEIVEFRGTGNISVTSCPFIILGNVSYNAGGYDHCSGAIPQSSVNLYSMQIDPYSYVTLDGSINAGGTVAQTPGTNINTALEIDQARLTCTGLAGNFAQNGSAPALNMNSIRATNSIIEITNPGTGGPFSPSGRTHFSNCTITCAFFDPAGNGYPSEKDEFYDCTINAERVYFSGSTISEFHASTFNLGGSASSGFEFGSSYPQNNSVILDSIKINVGADVSEFVLGYAQDNYLIKGDITCLNTNPMFAFRIVNGKQNCIGPGGTAPCYSYPIPLKLDGNLILHGGAILIQGEGTLDITGNLEMNGSADPNYTKDVLINGQKVFEIGGSNNYVNYSSGPYGSIPGGLPFGIKFSGSSDSHIKWSTGFPVDTLTIEKTGCAKVYIDSVPLHVTGKLQVNSGQLVLSSNTASHYALVNGGDLLIKDGGSLLTEDNADIALAGNFIDSNSRIDTSACHGFANVGNNTLSFYNTIYTPANRIIGSVSNTSVGNVKLINQDNESYTLQNNFVTNNFDLGGSGKVILGDNNFTVNGTLTSYSNANYFITNGTGGLILPDVNNLPLFFPVGISASSFTPVTIMNKGIKDTYKVRVQEGLYNNGESGTQITEKAVNRTWHVEEGTAGGANADITLQWNAEDELSSFDRNDAYLIHYTNNNWDFGTSMPAAGNNPYQLTRNNVTSFSPFAVSNQNTVLPLALLNFTATSKDNLIQLIWKTSNEMNALGFDVERSEDGDHFAKLFFSPAAANQGTVNLYNYNDLHPLQSNNYYRLKVIDRSGIFVYSKIVFVQSNTAKYSISIFPNPVRNILNLQVGNNGNGKISYRIINTSGKIFRRATVTTNTGAQTIPINTGFLSKGFYYLVVTNGTLNNIFKFIKE